MTKPAGEDQAPPRLAPAEAEAIVAIRGLLDEAVSRTADSTVMGRRVAAVLLDGAVEAALGAGLSKFNDSPRKNDALDELRQRLTEHLRATGRLKPSENLDGWADVKRLRLARNLAQHQQIPPDHQALAGWSGGVRRFVGHVVAAAFDAELAAVSAASAIMHDDLRAGFEQAEEARAQGETRTAVEALQRVLDDAVRLWNQQRRDAGGLPWGSPPDELGVSERIKKATHHLDQTLTMAPFAVDLGEYFWWQGLLRDVRDRRIVITADDAARALAFVFTWVVRWESFNARYLSRERVRGELPEVPPPSRRPDGAAELDPEREPTVEVRFKSQYPGSPPVEEWVFRVPYRFGRPEDAERYSTHDHHLDQALWSGKPPALWTGHVYRHGGDIELSVDPASFDPEAVLGELEVRFERALRRRQEEEAKAAAVRAERQRREEAAALAAPEVLAIRVDGVQPFQAVTLEEYGPDPSFLLRFTDEFRGLVATDLNETQPREWPEMPLGTHWRYDGIQVPFDRLHEARRLATESLAAIRMEQERIRGTRAAVYATADALDAAAKEASRRRSGRPRPEG